MRRTLLLTTLLASSLVLSGCLSGADDLDSDHDHGAGDHHPVSEGGNETDSGNQTDAPPDPAANAAPTASLSADVTSGDAPLLVNFSIEGGDADGDALSWTLDADGDGTTDREGDTLPANHEHNFTAAGNYTALLTISDGTNTTEATLDITIEAAETLPSPPDDIIISDSITGFYAGVDYVAVEDKSHNWSFDGRGVRNMTISVSFDDPTTVDLDWAVYAPDGTEVVNRASFNAPTEVEVPVLGTLTPQEAPHSVTDPALLTQTGDWIIEIYPGESVEGGYTVTIAFA